LTLKQHSLRLLLSILIFPMCLIWFSGCGGGNSITIYTSVDQDYAEPIIQTFQKQNPEIKVNAVYDSELTKTTGLYERIVHEKRNPQADVFWNSEIIRTVQLKQKNLLQPYESPSAADIDSRFKDPEHYWTGFSARARVMLINTNLVPDSETPSDVPALGNMKYKNKIGMANPQFGTTAGHIAALYTSEGKAVFTLRFNNYINNGVKILPGNATVRDQVSQGQLAYGITDSDDAMAALDEGKPVRMAYLGQNRNGTFLIPNTAALINDAPHPENGKKFLDYLLSADVEKQLAMSRGKQIPLRSSVERPEGVPDLSSLKIMKVDYEEIAKNLEPCLDVVRMYVR